MQRGQRLELGDELGVAAETKLEDHAVLGCSRSKLLEMCNRPAKRGLVREVAERGASPKLLGFSI